MNTSSPDASIYRLWQRYHVGRCYTSYCKLPTAKRSVIQQPQKSSHAQGEDKSNK